MFWAWVLAVWVAASCTSSGRIEGQVFISGVKDTAGKTIGVAVDFIPSQSNADLSQVQLDIEASKATLLVNGEATGAACSSLPSSGRLTLASSTGELSGDARVRVVARRTTTRIGASGAGASACTGEPIDDALWPTVGASVPPSTGGTSSGGASGESGSGGDGGEPSASGGSGGKS